MRILLILKIRRIYEFLRIKNANDLKKNKIRYREK